MPPLVATLYNPHTQTKQELIQGFVVRLPLFRKLFHEIKTAEMRYPEQHLLIEGQRGMGKTTLLLRLAYEIDTETRLIPIIFEEEAYYRITRLFQLWEETAKLLTARETLFHGLFERMSEGEDEQAERYERRSFEVLISTLQQHDRKLVLLIDNFSELCKALGEQEVQRLREVLLTCSEIRWVGATAGTLEGSFRYQHPFYEFFKKYSLEGLNREETKNLLLQLAQPGHQKQIIQEIITQQPGRVETLRILTGGVVRTIVLLFEVFVDQEHGKAIHDLEKILDRVTPLYKHRMDELPILQREVVSALAINWDGMNLSELMQRLRRPIDEVEASLTALKTSHLVELKVIDAQTQWYFLQERFFNIWYLMRLATGAKTRVIWLVRFLEAWYDEKQLKDRAQSQIRALEKPGYSAKAAYFYAEALAQTGKLDWGLEYDLKQATRKYIELSDQSLAQELSPADQELFEQAMGFLGTEKYEQAKALLLQIRQSNNIVCLSLMNCYLHLKSFSEAKRYYLMATGEEEDEQTMFHLAQCYENISEDYLEAERCYLIAIDKGNAQAMFFLARLYEKHFKDYLKAKRYYLMAIGKGNAQAMFFLAQLYENHLYENHFKDYLKAERYYLMAIDKRDAQAMFFLAQLYENHFKDYPKAEPYYLMAIEKKYVPHFSLFKDKQQAERYYLMAIDKEKENVDTILNMEVLYHNELKNYSKADYYLMRVNTRDRQAMCNLALLYENEFKDYLKAEYYYLMAIDVKDWKKTEVPLHKCTYEDEIVEYCQFKMEADFTLFLPGKEWAMVKLAVLYEDKFKDVLKAERYYLMALEHGEQEHALGKLFNLYLNILNQPEKAEACVLIWAEKGNLQALNNMAWIFFEKKIHKYTALCCAEQALRCCEKQGFGEQKDYIAHTLACIDVWHHHFTKAVEVAKLFIDQKDFDERYPGGTEVYLMLLLAKQQYSMVRDYFEFPQGMFKDRFKPIYYAFLSLTHDEAFGRMPPELNEPVTQILAKIHTMAEDYA